VSSEFKMFSEEWFKEIEKQVDNQKEANSYFAKPQKADRYLIDGMLMKDSSLKENLYKTVEMYNERGKEMNSWDRESKFKTS
jgi:hypothetical protein